MNRELLGGLKGKAVKLRQHMGWVAWIDVCAGMLGDTQVRVQLH